jgi:RHS repeat-associated protein
MTGATSYVTGTGYYPWGPVQQLDLGSGGAQHSSTFYDEATGRLTGIRTGHGTGPSSGWQTQLNTTYTYDPAGNLTQKWATEADATVNGECYRYDGLRQLTQAWTIPQTGNCATNPTQTLVGGADPYWHTFTYDTVSNRRTQVVHASGGDTTYTYAYPVAGGPQPHTVTSVTATGGTTGTSTYAYDPAGNTTTRNVMAKPGQTLTWDAEGYVATLTSSGATTSYIYDAGGNRLAAKDPTGETVYLGHTEIRRTSGAVAATRFYQHAGWQIATRVDTGTLTWQAADNHGTTELSVDGGTLALTRLRTDPFGNPRNTNPWPSTKCFVGGTTDPTGLTHLGAREYDPGTGRFISRDPVIDVASPQQANGYSYANNNPITTSDANGLRAFDRDEDGISFDYSPVPFSPKKTVTPPKSRVKDLKSQLKNDLVKSIANALQNAAADIPGADSQIGLECRSSLDWCKAQYDALIGGDDPFIVAAKLYCGMSATPCWEDLGISPRGPQLADVLNPVFGDLLLAMVVPGPGPGLGETIAAAMTKAGVEAASAARFEKIFGIALTATKAERDGDLEGQGATYDQMGNPKASEHWADQRLNFRDQLIRHGNGTKADFGLVDLTGFTDGQIKEIMGFYSTLPKAIQHRLIIINGESVVN